MKKVKVTFLDIQVRQQSLPITQEMHKAGQNYRDEASWMTMEQGCLVFVKTMES